jgi:NAD(P)-dependent dehydrogenase (short-subunit alcohol dehydrogenase family)
MEILVSGSSTGIGRATAVHMARKGHSVWAGVRSQKSFDDLQRLNVQGLQPVLLDVCDEKSIVDCVSVIRKKAGMLHALVNNAGIAIGGPVEGIKLSEWREQFETNVFGQVRVIQECLPSLRESKGRIVNISSIAGRLASPFMAPYAASKFAIEAMVSIVEPGPIATPIWEKGRSGGLSDVNRFDKKIMDVYGKSLQKFLKSIEQATQKAEPVSLVVAAIEHALTSAKPRTRYPVGRGIGFMTKLSGVAPDRVLDYIISGRA